MHSFSHVTHGFESCRTWEWVTSYIRSYRVHVCCWISKASVRIHSVMSHVGMGHAVHGSHVAHGNESCRTRD